MQKRLLIAISALLIIVALFVVFLAQRSVKSPPASVPCAPLQRGQEFLNARYNPSLGLLNEAPVAAPKKYWLANDNALAAHAFYRVGDTEMSDSLERSLERYGYSTNGLIEVVWGETVSFPPHVASSVILTKVGDAEIWQEFHLEGPRFEDWAEYADLGFLGALNEYAQGNPAESLRIFANTLSKFDGTGFRDKAYNGQYDTYKLAMALYAGATIHAPIPNGNEILDALQAMQAPDGGYFTNYTYVIAPKGDENTETTAWALLAQAAYGCGLE